IVLVHSLQPIGIARARIDSLYFLAQGVCFFFVLSGFILTYVYPRFERPAEIGTFLWARLARLWPVHVAAMGFGLLLLPWHFWSQILACKGKVLLAHLFLVQAWIPKCEYYFGINPVSWSISAEWLFYLCFPLFIMPWRLKPQFEWPTKIFLAACLLA